MITSSKMVQLNYSKRHNKSTKRSFSQQSSLAPLNPMKSTWAVALLDAMGAHYVQDTLGCQPWQA
jgi:hypothetical protein